MRNKLKISNLFFFIKIILVCIYNLLCIGIVLFPFLLRNRYYYYDLVLIFSFCFTFDYFTKNKAFKMISFVLKFIFILTAIPICFFIGRYAYFINPNVFILVFFILLIIYFLKLLFIKKTFLPLYFFTGIIVVSIVIANSFQVNRDNKKYEKILTQKYLKPILIFSKEYSKKCLYLVNAGSPSGIISDEKENYLFVTFQDKPRNSYSAVRIDFKTLNKIKVLFGEAAKTPSLDNNEIFIPIVEKRKIVVMDVNSFKVINEIFIKYNHSMQVAISKKRNELYVTCEEKFLQVFNLNSLKLKKQFFPPLTPYLVIIDEKSEKMYVGAAGIIGAANGKYCIVEINLKKLKITKTLGKIWWIILGIDINKKQNLLYTVDNLNGYLKVVNINNFKVIKGIYLGIGLREVVFDKKRNLIYIGNFISGDLYILHSKNYKLLKKIYVGDKIRKIYITPKSNRVLVANVYGVFEVKVDEILKKL